MAKPQPILPRTVNTDLSANVLPENVARFIKNLTLKKGANGTDPTSIGLNEEALHSLQATEVYGALNAPAGTNYAFSAHWFDVVNEVYVWCWNSEGNHFVYRIVCETATLQMVKIDRNFNFQLKPEYFVHENGAFLNLVKISNPTTGATVLKRDLYWTDGLNYPCYLRVDDCIATNGFDEALYPYFVGNYDKDILIRMGVPTLDDCIPVLEIPTVATQNTLNNDLLFQTWKFRVAATDVFGRPTEHGIIAYYVPGINDCLSTSDNVPRCLNLIIKVNNPLIDTINIEYLNDNNAVWYKSATLYLYVGDRVGSWWLRSRNPAINFNPATSEITHVFCADGEHEAIPVAETSRLMNPLPLNCQLLLELNKRIGLVNNELGFNPWPQDLLSKFKITIEKPTAIVDNELVSLTIYVPIYNPVKNQFGQSQKNGTNGYVWGVPRADLNALRNYQQYFANLTQSGWQGYLNDGDSVISTQVYLDGSGNWVDDPLFGGYYLSPTHLTAQKFVFTNKKKAIYNFRLSSHLTDPVTTPNFQSTSTTVWGLTPFVKTGSTYNINTNARERSQELVMNACLGNYSSLSDTKMLVIADLSGDDDDESKPTSGYVYETTRNGFNEFPVELIDVFNPASYTSNITDHNGFYWFTTTGSGREFDFNFSYKCAIAQFGLGEGNKGIMRAENIILETVDNSKWSDYSILECNRILIKGRIVLAGTNIGVSNSVVTLTRGGSAITDNNGNFTIIAHDDIRTYATGRVDKLLFSSVCIYHNEDGGCIPAIDVHLQPCNVANNCAERDYDAGGWVLTYDNFRGLLSGGSYRVGACPGDWLGRRAFIQDLGVLNIPTVAETGTIAPCRVKITIPSDALFPVEDKWFTLFITAELNNADYVETIIDKVEFIDITGQVNNVNPTQIRLWYSSLNEFNKQNNFSTTVSWNFLVQDTNNPVTGDKVIFIVNGDGSIYNQSIVSLVKYDKEGQYFLVDYKPALAKLQANAKVRLVHPKQSYSEAEPFYEICDSRVNLDNGVPDRTEFYFNAFDTYYLSRQYPVPTSLNNLTESITNTTATQSGDITNTVSVQMTQPVAYANELKTLGFYFEHHSPSNFWGLHCWNYGRKNVRNVNEAKLINYNEVSLSGEMLPTGVLSYLQYFDRALAISFDIPNTGGIYGALVMPGRVLFITQSGNFIVGYQDNLLRQNNDGTISASAANGFGRPEVIADYKYGVSVRDKNTIGVKDDTITFVDGTLCELVGLRPTNPGGTIHYTQNKHDMLFTEKIKSMIGTNRYFHKAINPLTNEYLITDFNLDLISYINQERWYNAELNETLSFDIRTGDFLGTFSFTPECYAGADGDLKSKQLFSFKNGVPYAHYNLSQNTVFNTFYGVECERVLIVVHNAGMLDEKSFKWIEVYCKYLFFSPKITTDTGQLSRINKKGWQRRYKFYRAKFLSDLNTPDVNNRVASKLFNGNTLYGRNVTIVMVGDQANNNQYCEVAGIIIFSAKIEKSGL